MLDLQNMIDICKNEIELDKQGRRLYNIVLCIDEDRCIEVPIKRLDYRYYGEVYIARRIAEILDYNNIPYVFKGTVFNAEDVNLKELIGMKLLLINEKGIKISDGHNEYVFIFRREYDDNPDSLIEIKIQYERFNNMVWAGENENVSFEGELIKRINTSYTKEEKDVYGYKYKSSEIRLYDIDGNILCTIHCTIRYRCSLYLEAFETNDTYKLL